MPITISTEMPLARAFIQARMSSERFPGKVLAPFNGRPMVAQVLAQVEKALPTTQIILATSTHPSDDPLACYVRQLGFTVHRGSLEDVFDRFRSCLLEYPCIWFIRICADSPLFDSRLVHQVLHYAEHPEVDLVTNVQRRTFPKGHSVEMVHAERFAAIEPTQLTADEKEHVTRFYYNYPNRFRIVNLESGDANLARENLVVDTLDDYRRLQGFARNG